MKNLILIVLALVVLAGAWLLIRKPETMPIDTAGSQVDVGGSSAVTGTNDGTTVTDGSILVTTPVANSTTTSPVSLSGNARGNWFFEASAPVLVMDARGNTLGQGTIHADGDWMTTNYVPFSGSVAYTLPNGTTTDGFIVFMNDNPSGDPARSVSVRIPIHFKR
ncbi:MAG: Gmad2 immunoglobulin-like domain-containing protein [Patescibacteria group bacterium]